MKPTAYILSLLFLSAIAIWARQVSENETSVTVAKANGLLPKAQGERIAPCTQLQEQERMSSPMICFSQQEATDEIIKHVSLFGFHLHLPEILAIVNRADRSRIVNSPDKAPKLSQKTKPNIAPEYQTIFPNPFIIHL